MPSLNINTKDKNVKTVPHQTPIGHETVALLLLKNGADIHVKNINGETALHKTMKQ